MIVLDTAELFEDYGLNRPWIRALSAYADATGTRAVVPRVVVEELVRQARDDLYKPASQALKKLRRIDPTVVALPTEDAFVSQTRSNLEKRIKDLGFEILEPPAVDHRLILDRMNARLRPFKPGGEVLEKGYKDYLIWRTGLEAAAGDGDELTLVSRNKDFGNQALHGDLVKEAQEFQVRASLLRGSEALLQELLRPWMRTAEGVLVRLGSAEARRRFTTALEEETLRSLPGNTVEPHEVGLDSEFDELTYGLFGEIEDLSIDDASEIDENEAIVAVSGDLEITFDAYPMKSSAYALAERYQYFSVSNWDWNNHVVEGEVTVVARLSFRVLIDRDDLSIRSVEVVDIDPYDYDGT